MFAEPLLVGEGKGKLWGEKIPGQTALGQEGDKAWNLTRHLANFGVCPKVDVEEYGGDVIWPTVVWSSEVVTMCGGVAACVGPWSADSSGVCATVASQKRSRAFGLRSVRDVLRANRCVQSQSPATISEKQKISHPRPQALNQNNSPVSDACLPRIPSH